VKYSCFTNFSITNGEDYTYAIAPKGAYKEYLGKPVFYLRHTYHRGDNLEPYFALIQTVDTTTIFNPQWTNTKEALRAYLTAEYGTELAGLIITQLDTVRTMGGTSHVGEFNPGLFVASVDDQTFVLKESLRAESQTRISTFRLEKDTDPIYRRFDQPQYEGPGDGPERDAPKTVKFRQFDNPQLHLFENTGAIQKDLWTGRSSGNGERNYLGEINIHQYPQANTNIYVDTAYVNRGTGYIKPQYLLMVDPWKAELNMVCDPATGEYIEQGEEYLRGRYLINAYDSAHVDGSLDARYLWNTQWERLIFVDAIHARDRLFILDGLSEEVLKTVYYDNSTIISLDKLEAAATAKNPTVKSVDLGDNKHKDCVFSFRLIERDANDFLIESESNNRDSLPIIRPCEGGWIKIQDNVPVISRASRGATIYVDAMVEGAIFNVIEGEKDLATANEAVETPATVTVIGGAGSVTIQGAAGKSVVITNLLGQSITNAVLTSDNATVAAPKGLVIVSVEGEDAVKAIVK
jgi:hypothetical protein